LWFLHPDTSKTKITALTPEFSKKKITRMWHKFILHGGGIGVGQTEIIFKAHFSKIG
jgi:hypothetical protein